VTETEGQGFEDDRDVGVEAEADEVGTFLEIGFLIGGPG
jgi:hypothetical protein